MGTESSTEIYELEKLFNEELECEFSHKAPENCTKSATHRVADCKKAAFVCAYGAELIFQMIEAGNKCMHCNRPALACWKVLSV